MEWLKIDFQESSGDDFFPDPAYEKVPHTFASEIMRTMLYQTDDKSLMQFLVWQGFEVESEGSGFILTKGWKERSVTREEACEILLIAIEGVLV